MTNNFIGSGSSGPIPGGDSYSAPPIDSYAPGKYAPSFLKQRPNIPAPPPHFRPQMIPPSMRPPRPFNPQNTRLAPVNVQRPFPQGRYPPPPIPTKVCCPYLQVVKKKNLIYTVFTGSSAATNKCAGNKTSDKPWWC